MLSNMNLNINLNVKYFLIFPIEIGPNLVLYFVC